MEEEERERTTPIVAFDYGFLTQENTDTFPVLICRDSRYSQAGATHCDQDTILELTGKIQELQNEINCMNDSRDFQDAESIRSGNSHVTSRPVSFPPHPIPEGMLSRSIGMPSRREGPPSIWDTHGTLGNVFANPVARHLQHLIRRNCIHGIH